MGACSVQISGITFEGSRQPFLHINGGHRSRLHACSTGQRLHCPDDSTCPYSTSDKSALLRHRQRKHGYRAKPTASKVRYDMNVSKNRMRSSEILDDPSNDDSSPSAPSDSRCPCYSPTVSESSGQAYGANDETDIWQDDDHASQETTGMTKQTIESIRRSLVEGHVASRFPVSFARTRLPPRPENGALPASARKHCRCRMSKLQSTPALVAQSNSIGSNPVPRIRTGVKIKEVVIYRRVSYLVPGPVSGHMLDKSGHHLSRSGRGLTSYCRVSTRSANEGY